MMKPTVRGRLAWLLLTTFSASCGGSCLSTNGEVLGSDVVKVRSSCPPEDAADYYLPAPFAPLDGTSILDDPSNALRQADEHSLSCQSSGSFDRAIRFTRVEWGKAIVVAKVVLSEAGAQKTVAEGPLLDSPSDQDKLRRSVEISPEQQEKVMTKAKGLPAPASAAMPHMGPPPPFVALESIENGLYRFMAWTEGDPGYSQAREVMDAIIEDAGPAADHPADAP